MLIYLSFSVPQARALDASFLAQAFTSILHSHRFRLHFAVLERDLADWAVTSLPLGEADRATLRRLRQSYTQHRRMVDIADHYIRVVAADAAAVGSAHTLSEADGRAILLTLRELMNSSILSGPTSLLVEDIASDGELFSFLIENCHSVMGLPKPSYRLLHGGGDSIDSVFEATLRMGVPVAVVFDTDFDAPTTSPCAKERRLRAAVARTGARFGFVAPLPCRESENVVPAAAVLAHTHLKSCRGLPILMRIESLEGASGCAHDQRFWLYFDMKGGLAAGAYQAIEPASARSWVAAKCASAGHDPDAEHIEGFGGRAAARVLSEGSSASALREELRTQAWQAVFGSFMRRLLWILAGGRRQFA